MVREYESTVPSIWSLLLKLLRIISSPSRASYLHLHLHSRRPSLVPHMIPDPTSHILHSTFQDKRLNEPKLHLSCSSHLTPCATPSHVCQRTTDEPSTNTRLHCCLPACLSACLPACLPPCLCLPTEDALPPKLPLLFWFLPRCWDQYLPSPSAPAVSKILYNRPNRRTASAALPSPGPPGLRCTLLGSPAYNSMRPVVLQPTSAVCQPLVANAHV
jgi:hypothetical protein